jgi:hypothetical protein
MKDIHEEKLNGEKNEEGLEQDEDESIKDKKISKASGGADINISEHNNNSHKTVGEGSHQKKKEIELD